MSDIPKKIDRYPVIKSLGKGGMGEVYLAHDPICERKIAIKCIRSDLLRYKNITKRFLNEAKIASQFSHPSIVPIYSIHAGDEKMYYIMPYVEGETLKQILRDTYRKEKAGKSPHPVGGSIQSLLRIFMHICHAIDYAHSKGFLHRDIKPENVIVGKFGEVLLLDWGLAEKCSYVEEIYADNFPEQEGLTRIGKIIGTPSYMAPERVKGEKASYKTDIYSLGVILYQLLTLRLPFKRKDIKDFQRKVEKEVYIDPSEIAPSRDIPKALCDIVKKTLEPFPENRYEKVSDLLQEVNHYLEGRPDWILEQKFDIETPSQFAFQETVLLKKHMAISQLGPLSQWVILMLSKGMFTGNIKIEATISLKPHSEGLGLLFSIPEPKKRKSLEDGFCLWLGSENNKGIRLILDNVEVIQFKDLFISDTPSRVTIEKIDGNVFFYINDEPIFSYVGHIPIAGAHIGLICKDTLYEIADWEVYVGSQNAMVNCLSIPDAFFASKHYDQALFEYRRISESFKGRFEGREAIFRTGITLIEKASLIEEETEKNKLFDIAHHEFGKLHKTAGAPLEYLGKSLICKEEGDLEEEEKCLELATRKYPHHRLVYRVHEHIIFRLHELSNRNRKGTYLFALLAIRHLKEKLTSQDNKQLIQLLKDYLEPLYFLERPKQFNTEQDALISLAIELSFWLAKPMTLLELSEGSLTQPLINNIYLSLFHLNCKDEIQKLLLLHPHPIFAKIVGASLHEAFDLLLKEEVQTPFIQRVILSLLDQSFIHPELKLNQLFKKASEIPFKDSLREHFDSLHMQYLILQKEGQQAQLHLKNYSETEIGKPNSPLYIPFGLLNLENSKTIEQYFTLLQSSFPPIPSYIGHILSENIREDWFKKAFYWEKIQFYRTQLMLFAQRQNTEKVEYFLKLLKEN